MLDTTTEFGARVVRRLNDEQIIWLTTVDSQQMPQPVPVWFLWDGATFLIYSQPNTPKLRNIARNPQVALHLDGDGRGGNIVVLTGTAQIIDSAPLATDAPVYLEKYREGIKRIQMTPESFAQSYSVTVRVTPTRVRGH
ncbi:MAG: TIGR03667 family PPOX class F420-dependent oxidoreductase [Chloroflexales bacterium]|nr:TIGR03667 family PPOX class F420-dependent oxidoreductase [Chloroflexales bacterium]